MIPQDNVKKPIPSLTNEDFINKDRQAIQQLVLAIINGDQENYSLLNLLESAIQQQSPLDDETALTLSLLSSDIEHQANLNDQLHALLCDQGYPALALFNDGKVAAHNQAAADIFGELTEKNILRLGVNQSDFLDFKDRVLRHQGASILQLYADNNKNKPLIFTGQYQSDHQLFLIRMIGLKWSESMETALHDIFKLTKAERDVLVCLARGMQTEQISVYRQSKSGTVRQQIKSILQKLGVTSQIQAVSLAASLGNQSNSEHTSVSSPLNGSHTLGNSSKPDANLLQQDQFIRENRRVGWRRYGRAGGKPVLLMHSCYFGAGDYDLDRILTKKSGLDIIIVERPGYGSTHPPSLLSTESILDTHIKDCVFLLNQLSWETVWLKSDDFGFVHALAFANCYPDKVNGLFAVSPLPLFASNNDFSTIPIQQKSFIWAARHCFWMIKLLLRLGHVKARQLGPKRWMEMLFDGTPEELPFFQTEAGKKVSERSYHFNLNQKSKGQVLDLQVSIANDWTQLLKKVTVPTSGITGKQNTTYNIESIRHLTTINPDFKIKEIEKGSLTLTLTHAEESHTSFLEFMDTLSLP